MLGFRIVSGGSRKNHPMSLTIRRLNHTKMPHLWKVNSVTSFLLLNDVCHAIVRVHRLLYPYLVGIECQDSPFSSTYTFNKLVVIKGLKLAILSYTQCCTSRDT